MAANNEIVVTVDHSYQSGAVELDNHTVIFNLAGRFIKPREANYARVVDLLAVAHHFYNQSNLEQTTLADILIDPNSTFVLGHGQGGLVAQMLVGSNIFPGGGILDSLMPMPAPFTEKNVLYHNRTSPSKSKKPTPTLPHGPEPTSPPKPLLPPHGDENVLDRLKRMARGLRKTMLDTLSGLMCRIVSKQTFLNPGTFFADLSLRLALVEL